MFPNVEDVYLVKVNPPSYVTNAPQNNTIVPPHHVHSIGAHLWFQNMIHHKGFEMFLGIVFVFGMSSMSHSFP
jgi:hypothetical protein